MQWFLSQWYIMPAGYTATWVGKRRYPRLRWEPEQWCRDQYVCRSPLRALFRRKLARFGR